MTKTSRIKNPPDIGRAVSGEDPQPELLEVLGQVNFWKNQLDAQLPGDLIEDAHAFIRHPNGLRRFTRTRALSAALKARRDEIAVGLKHGLLRPVRARLPDSLALLDRAYERAKLTARLMRPTSMGAISVTPLLSPKAESIDVIVCVHNAVEDVRNCLDSILRQSRKPTRLIIVDDGSEPDCARWLEEFAKTRDAILLRNDFATGYTRAVNRGLSHSSSQCVLLLNSDATLPSQGIERMLAHLESDPRLGIVGPVSNAASWQSIPKRMTDSGQWMVNELPHGLTPDEMSDALAAHLPHWRPELPLLNGFCMMIRRAVFDAIGFFDEDNFPRGYGEENDFCLRARDAGFRLSCTIDCYVHHAKSKSYGHSQREKLSASGAAALERKHGQLIINHAVACMDRDDLLAEARRIAARVISGNEQPSILFLLPLPPGGGGGHSVVQEVHGMRVLGFDAQIACRPEDVSLYRAHYPNVDPAAFVEMSRQRFDRDIVVATIFHTVEHLLDMVAFDKRALPAYYIQDYEPWFFTAGSSEHLQATSSYERIEGMVRFAKTDWLVDLLVEKHGGEVHKVRPSIDHSIYRPQSKRQEKFTIAAMLRPSTPRRAPERILSVLKRLRADYDFQIHVFGATNLELRAHGLDKPPGCKNWGPITREQVADLLSQSDFFLDFSDYQAFGRTGLEAMACGCIPVLPKEGGATEYLKDGYNGHLVDTRSSGDCLQTTKRLLEVPQSTLSRMRSRALDTASKYTIESAARSELELLSSMWVERRARAKR